MFNVKNKKILFNTRAKQLTDLLYFQKLIVMLFPENVCCIPKNYFFLTIQNITSHPTAFAITEQNVLLPAGKYL